MKKARIIIVVVAVLCAAAALFTMPESRAENTKTQAKNVTFTKDIAPIFFR